MHTYAPPPTLTPIHPIPANPAVMEDSTGRSRTNGTQEMPLPCCVRVQVVSWACDFACPLGSLPHRLRGHLLHLTPPPFLSGSDGSPRSADSALRVHFGAEVAFAGAGTVPSRKSDAIRSYVEKTHTGDGSNLSSMPAIAAISHGHGRTNGLIRGLVRLPRLGPTALTALTALTLLP